MRPTLPSLIAALLVAVPAPSFAAPAPKAADKPVAASVQSTLKSATTQIRQFAFDGSADTYFASAGNARKTDHFTLTFDKPVAVKSVTVTTGKKDGADRLDAGILEVSADGKTFERLAGFTKGVATAKLDGRRLMAVRIRPAADLKHALVIREITVESTPAVAVFKYPIEIRVDVTDAPDMKDWAEKCARLCERQYPMICEELQSDGFKPRTVITMRLRNMRGVAYASRGRITGSVAWFKRHPKDVGAMVHETVHCVQSYRSRRNPGWLVEGVADYIRFFKFEPGHLGRINPRRARYNASYRVTAAFLAYVTDKYDPHLVRKLNKTMRNGEYKEDIWTTLTKKTVQELDKEWRASLQRPKKSPATKKGKER
jgi:Peptidase of plants and bacteria/F5/8 type C domain